MVYKLLMIFPKYFFGINWTSNEQELLVKCFRVNITIIRSREFKPMSLKREASSPQKVALLNPN